jgi:membrane fusion protein (multidrug efflux system)
MPDGVTTAKVRREQEIIRREAEGVSRPDEAEPRRGQYSRRKLVRYSLFALGAIVLIIAALWYWLSGGQYVETDDAYVQGNVLNVATDVSGIVADIPVSDGEHVKKGQVLFRLDPLKFQLAVDQTQANLAQTRLNLQSLKADYDKAQRELAADLAVLKSDQATYDRYANLVKQHAITQQQYDDAKYKVAQDQATFGGGQASVKAALARLGGDATIPSDQMPAYKQAQAQLGEAERQFRHSVVRAPLNGEVTRVSKLQIGQYLPAGTAAFGLVASEGMWVTAQPKETKLTYARPGQPVTVTIDAYPSWTWHGTVQSIAPATDQEFSVLPAQNSSGNWVKVVQRVPVRVTLQSDPGAPPLSAGMSAEISINTGHKRHLSDLF